jgi:hypothetical protein
MLSNARSLIHLHILTHLPFSPRRLDPNKRPKIEHILRLPTIMQILKTAREAEVAQTQAAMPPQQVAGTFVANAAGGTGGGVGGGVGMVAIKPGGGTVLGTNVANTVGNAVVVNGVSNSNPSSDAVASVPPPSLSSSPTVSAPGATPLAAVHGVVLNTAGNHGVVLSTAANAAGGPVQVSKSDTVAATAGGGAGVVGGVGLGGVVNGVGGVSALGPAVEKLMRLQEELKKRCVYVYVCVV